jgi:SAM-dependent methyltransferase
MSPAVHGLLVVTLTTAAAVALARQCRKPTWWPGRLFAHLMNSSHRGVTTWGLTHVPFEPHVTILDVGCGGGRTIQELLARAPAGKVYGIDYASASVAVATKLNASSIAAGRADVRRGDVAALPYPPNSFDVVTAIETHYYWPDLNAALGEIFRVLKPDGCVAIVAESYRGKRCEGRDRLAMRLIGGTLLTTGEHREQLIGAGFVDVDVYEDRNRGWICVVGKRASRQP